MACRVRRYPARAHAVAVCASLRLRCDLRSGGGAAELAALLRRYAQTAAASMTTSALRASVSRPQITAATEIALAGYRLTRHGTVGVPACTPKVGGCANRDRWARDVGLVQTPTQAVAAGAGRQTRFLQRLGWAPWGRILRSKTREHARCACPNAATKARSELRTAAPRAPIPAKSKRRADRCSMSG